MSQQAKYITNLERALEGLLECFYQQGNNPITTEVVNTVDGLSLGVVDLPPTEPTLEAIAYGNQVMYGEDALMEDEI